MRRVAFAIFFMASISFINEAIAYQFTDDFSKGFYWRSFPFSLTSFVVSESDGEQLASLVKRAENEWEDAIGKDIWAIADEYVIGPLDNSNNIRWSEDFAAETGYDPSSTLAITIRYSSGTFMIKTEIILNAQFPGMRENVNQMLYKTILHEMGHTIGLNHSSETSIMAANLGEVSSLQEDDVLGANAVIDETLRRQATGFVSEFSRESSSNTLVDSCGSMAFAGTGEEAPIRGFPLEFLFSFLGGILIIILVKKMASFLL